jgi:hypothetical protein
LVTVQVLLERYLTFVWYYLNAEFQVNALMIIVYSTKKKIIQSFFVILLYRNCACTSGLLFNINTCNDVNRRICGGNVSKINRRIFAKKSLCILPILLSLKFKWTNSNRDTNTWLGICSILNMKFSNWNIIFKKKLSYWFDERLSTIRPLAFSISFGNACKLLWLRSSIDKSGLSNKREDIWVFETWLSRNDNERNDVKSFIHNGTSGRSLCAKLNFS